MLINTSPCLLSEGSTYDCTSLNISVAPPACITRTVCFCALMFGSHVVAPRMQG